jgi:hypothetical protein
MTTDVEYSATRWVSNLKTGDRGEVARLLVND